MNSELNMNTIAVLCYDHKYIYSQLLYVGHIHVENQCSLQQDVQHLQEQHDVLTQKLDNLITKLDNHSMLYNN